MFCMAMQGAVFFVNSEGMTQQVCTSAADATQDSGGLWYSDDR